jgi:hypothetical protein
MKSAIFLPMERVVVCLCGALAAVACADGRGTPTSPTASPAAASLPAVVPDQGTIPQTVATTEAPSAFSQSHPLLLTKTCDAIDHCTVITAEAGRSRWEPVRSTQGRFWRTGQRAGSSSPLRPATQPQATAH